MVSTKLLDKDFTKAVLEEVVANGGDPNDPEATSNAVVKAFNEEGLSMGFGGHVLVGSKVKLPIIPIAVYVDGKYHFGGYLPEQVSAGFTLEMGGALAF